MSDENRQEQPKQEQPKQEQPKQEQPKQEQRRLRPRAVARRAAEELVDLLGAPPEAVTGLERHDGTWVVQLDVVEVERIPATTSIIAAYEVQLDDAGDLVGYHRTGRHVRGRTEER